MPKVFVVTEGEYSDYHISAAFSSRELAEAYIKTQADPEATDSGMNIEEFGLDLAAEPVEWVTYYSRSIQTINGAAIPSREWQRRMPKKGHKRGDWVYLGDEIRGGSFVSSEHAHKMAVEGRQAHLRDWQKQYGSEEEEVENA